MPRSALTLPRLHVVTDDSVLALPDFPVRAGEVLTSGAAAVALHLRGAAVSGGALHALGMELLEVAARSGALLVINDRVDVAMALAAEAVHLGARSLPASRVRRLVAPGVLVGVSIHGPGEVASEDPVDYLFAGPVYPTASHPGGPGRGAGWLTRMVEVHAGTPVVAIGGITPARVGEVMGAGAAGVAAIRGVWQATDPGAAVACYLEAMTGSDHE